MKHLSVILIFLACSLTVHAELSLKEIRTASNNVVVAYFKSDIIKANEVDINDLSQWRINGQPVQAINRFVTEADACDHHIYLQGPRLVNGQRYTVQTPHGNTSFTFDDRNTFCESIKTNQNAYSALSKVRYANFAIWLGNGGSQQIAGDLPTYAVVRVATGGAVTEGRLKAMGQDESSGDFVYRIDLSAVPEGGPYKISVKGYGRSYPFGVGGAFSRRLAHISFRSLYHQRCGCPIKAPYAWNIRMKPCHTTVYDTNAPIGEARLVVDGNEPTFTAYGGYHDAGDADRRTYHMDVPVTLLTTYEAFPSLFTDKQYNIPDRFDKDFNIVGSGNGIPDIIDEAEWGTMFWEDMQKPSGEIHWGTETYRYSPFTTYDKETKRFGTEVLDSRSAGFAAGLFMHLARIIKPYKPDRSKELARRADLAFKAAGEQINATHHLYYAIQKYLLTGDKAAHQSVKALAENVTEYVDTFNGPPESFAGSRQSNRPNRRRRAPGWLASFFYSYIIEKDRPTDPAVVQQFRAALETTAHKAIGYLEGNAYPVGTPMNLRWWGSNAAQGQYAYPCLLHWGLTQEQRYIDAASQLMDYNQGLNPIGKCYVCGTGFNRVHNPHDRESAYTKEMGWGPRPGVLVFGPGGRGNGTSVPELRSLPRERQFIDNLPSIQWTEFTVYQSLCFPAAVYPVLAQGGTWNDTDDPFAVQEK